jgi:hypothetical protein
MGDSMTRLMSACAISFAIAAAFRAAPAEARFLQTDPAGYKDDPDWYTYVGNDPADHVDPLGLYSCGSSVSSGQCGTFMSTQDAAKVQITTAMKQIATLRTDLASGKMSAQDRMVAATISQHLGSGAGTNGSVLGKLLGSASKMLGMLNSNMPAQNGAGSSAYAHADPGQLTLFPNYWTSSRTQQIETVAHESSHHGANTTDEGLLLSPTQPILRPYGHGNIHAMAAALNDPDGMLTRADAVTLSLGFERDDQYK